MNMNNSSILKEKSYNMPKDGNSSKSIFLSDQYTITLLNAITQKKKKTENIKKTSPMIIFYLCDWELMSTKGNTLCSFFSLLNNYHQINDLNWLKYKLENPLAQK